MVVLHTCNCYKIWVFHHQDTLETKSNHDAYQSLSSIFVSCSGLIDFDDITENPLGVHREQGHMSKCDFHFYTSRRDLQIDDRVGAAGKRGKHNNNMPLQRYTAIFTAV